MIQRIMMREDNTFTGQALNLNFELHKLSRNIMNIFFLPIIKKLNERS